MGYFDKGMAIRIFAAFTLLSFVVSAASIPVIAHMPGAEPTPEFELGGIVIEDGGGEIEITMDDVGDYHNEQAKKLKRQKLKKSNPNMTDEKIDEKINEEFAGTDGKCPCTSCAFRAALFGISEVWGGRTPKRNDIKIISNLSTPGSCQCFQYITGTGPKIDSIPQYDPGSNGMFRIILPNGTEIKNKSMTNIKKNGVNTNINNWHFNNSRKSTGEYFVVDVEDDVYPDDFFDLRRKVKYDEPENATDEETEKFTVEWEEARNTFLTNEDWELFEGVEEPEEDLSIIGVTFFAVLVLIIVVAIIGISRKKNKK